MLIIQTYLSIFCNFNSSNLSFSYDYGSLDTSTMCRYLPFYLRRHTNMNCTDNMLTMEIYYNASLWANYYCQKDFEMRPWNCSSDRRYIRKLTDHCKLRIDLLSKAVNAVKSQLNFFELVKFFWGFLNVHQMFGIHVLSLYFLFNWTRR